jgi:hypothetical protein
VTGSSPVVGIVRYARLERKLDDDECSFPQGDRRLQRRLFGELTDERG